MQSISPTRPVETQIDALLADVGYSVPTFDQWSDARCLLGSAAAVIRYLQSEQHRGNVIAMSDAPKPIAAFAAANVAFPDHDSDGPIECPTSHLPISDCLCPRCIRDEQIYRRAQLAISAIDGHEPRASQATAGQLAARSGQPSLTKAFEVLRNAGGSDWDRVANPKGYLDGTHDADGKLLCQGSDDDKRSGSTTKDDEEDAFITALIDVFGGDDPHGELVTIGDSDLSLLPVNRTA